MSRPAMPEIVPVLSRGKHRSPRKGACFMEYASFLAGEKWSDHPKCTHPLLAGVARDVNDHISDDGRPLLVPLIPSVVGLNGDDSHVYVAIAVRCAVMALPVVAESRQKALAAGLFAARRVFDELDTRADTTFEAAGLSEAMNRSLASTPQAARWARSFVGEAPISPKIFTRRSAPNIVHVSVVGIAEACIPDRDGLLHDLLAAVIRDCESWLGEPPSPLPEGATGPSTPQPLKRRWLARHT